MIRVTVELIPHGREALAETIAVGEIWNDGTSLVRGLGNYGFRLEDDRHELLLEGKLQHHNRAQTVWALLRRTLNAAFA